MRGRLAERLRTEWQSVHGPPASASFSFEPVVVLVSGALLLTLMQFHGSAAELGRILIVLEHGPAWLAAPASSLFRGPWFELASYAFWALACFAGYFVAPAHRGRGLGRALVLHSFDAGRQHGFDALQFNFVFETNPARTMWCGPGSSYGAAAFPARRSRNSAPQL